MQKPTSDILKSGKSSVFHQLPLSLEVISMAWGWLWAQKNAVLFAEQQQAPHQAAVSSG